MFQKYKWQLFCGAESIIKLLMGISFNRGEDFWFCFVFFSSLNTPSKDKCSNQSEVSCVKEFGPRNRNRIVLNNTVGMLGSWCITGRMFSSQQLLFYQTAHLHDAHNFTLSYFKELLGQILPLDKHAQAPLKPGSGTYSHVSESRICTHCYKERKLFSG